MRFVATLVLSLALVVTPAARQPPAFKAQTDLIEVSAVVTGPDARPVAGLRAADFEVEEDGKPVVVSAFAAIDSDFAREPAEGRFIVLLLDDVVPDLTYRIKQIAHMFADRMSGNDVVAVLSLNGSHHKTTTRKDLVSQQIDAFKPYTPALPSPARGLGNICPECERMMDTGPSGSTRARSASHALDTISSLSKQLSQVEHRRKTIVCIGEARLFDVSIGRNHSIAGWSAAIKAASRANVSIDVIDPRGLTPFEPSSLLAPGGPLSTYDGARGFASETGGRAIVNSNFFGRSVDEIWQESGHYYLLGYVAPTSKRGLHSIGVRVRRPGVEVRARKTRA
jgi:VWFA-related protein